jgi:transposase-like protein
MDGNMQMWFATDPLNKDTILGYHRAESADAASLTAFLANLRDEYGLRPLLFTGDDARVYDKTPAQVWPGVPVQLCHFHALRCLVYKHLRHSLRARLLAIKPPPPRRRRHTPEAFQALQREHKAALPEWAKLHRKRRLFLKSLRSLAKDESVKHEEAAFIDSACQRHPTLAAFRQLILDMYAIMDSKDAAAADVLRRAFLAKWASEAESDSHVRAAVSKFANDCWFSRLFPFTAFENAHRTTNSTERANRWFRKRQKTHYRNRKEHTIVKMLHADLIYRRERAPDGPPNRLRERPVQLPQTG